MVIAMAGPGNGCSVPDGDAADAAAAVIANTLVKPNVLNTFKARLRQKVKRLD
jgi:hypothetical protein